MKIAFLKMSPTIASTNGVKSQMESWKKGLEDLGHQVVFVDMLIGQDWESYDIIHCFDFGEYMSSFVSSISSINPNIVLSPIIDTNWSISLYKLVTYWGSRRLRLSNRFFELRKVRDLIKMYYVRSNYEKRYITEALGVSESRVMVVPLASRFSIIDKIPPKKNFCLHVSLLGDERKNVKRIVEAAIKYDFELVLVGKLRSSKEIDKLENLISRHNNIKYLGVLPDDELKKLYLDAKVFALPSTYEGVGLVALEAACFGCDVVITNLGGPKEYYGRFAHVVNPYDVDAIGTSIKRLLEGETFQPELMDFININFSLEKTVKLLLKSYKQIQNKK